MKQFIRYILTLVAILMATTNAWAAWAGNGQAVKEENGTYYVYYDMSEKSKTAGGLIAVYFDAITLEGPGSKVEFEAKKSSSLGSGNLVLRVNNGSWVDVWSNGLSKSYNSYSTDINYNATQIQFYMPTGGLKKAYKSLKVTMAQYIENPSKTTFAFGSGKVDNANSVDYFTIPWCNVPAMSWTKTGEGSEYITVSVDNNSEPGKYNTAKFTITYDRSKASNLNVTLTIKDSYNSYSKTITITGSTSKYDQTLSWNNESAIETNMQLGKTQTVTATASSGLAVTYTSSNPSVLTVDENGKITAVGIGSATITASQAGNYKYSAANSITKTYTVWNKNTPIFTPSGFNEDDVCHMKVGDKVTLEVLNVSDGLSGDFKVTTDNNILGVTRNGNTITIEALNAGTTDAVFTQTENNNIFNAEKKYKFSVTKINNTLAIAANSYTKYVDDVITNIISSVNSNAAITTTSTDATIAYYDVASNKILIPNSEAKSLSSCAITITIAQAETYKFTAAEKTITLTVNKHTPTFIWNASETPYYYGTSIPNIFSTTNSDVETTFASDNEAFARVEYNTLYIANARETATITVTQQENYKWNGKTEQYVIAPVNGDNHVQFTINSENYYNVFRYDNTGNLSWKNDGVLLGSPDVGSGAFDYNDRYYDIVFTGVPDTLSFTYERSTTIATDCDWYVKESADGVTWSEKNVWEIGNSNSGSVEVQLSPTTHYLRFCYSGNYGGYFRNIHVSERFQFEATPTAIDFGSEGITYGMQRDTVTFLHANAGRITRAVITGDDAKYFNVTPELVPGTGRDCFGNAALEVTFDNLGEDRGATPYNATLVISDNSDKTEDIHIPLTGIRDGKSTADIIWNPNALPYYFNSTIANIAYSTNRDANCPLTFATTDNTIAEVKNGDLHIYNKGQEVTITVTQPGNADFMPATKSFTFTPCERPSLEVPFRVSQALHAKSVQLGTKSGWYQDDNQIRIASTSFGDGFIWGDDRKRVLITFAGTPDKLYFEYSSSDAATTESLKYGWEVEESANGTDWNTVWATGSLSASWNTSGEIDLSPNTQYIRFSYKGNFAGYLRNIIISSLEGNNYLRAEEGGYLSRGAKWGTQAVVDPFGMVCRVSHFTVDNTNIYTRLQFVDNMQYLYETADTKEVFTDAAHANNNAYLWQINSNASGKFTVQSANDLGNDNRGNYFTIINNTLAFTSDPAQATVWYMETPAQHNDVVKSYMDAAAAKAAEKDFGSDINTLEKVRSSLNREDFEITEVTVPPVALAEQAGVYRDEINGTGTFAVYDTIISGLKPGFYRLTVKALYRISDSQKAQAAKTNGWESVLAYIYANDVKYPIQSVYTSYNAGNYDASDEIYNGHSYPTKLIPSVERAFNQDHNRYLNDVYVYVEADPGQTTGTLRYGIKNPSYVPGAWLAYSTITLTHFGRKEYIFQGTDSNNPIDWHTPANWNRNAVPDQYHHVRIEANVNISSHAEVFSLTIDRNAQLHITATGGLSVGAQGIQGAASDGSSIIIDNLKTGAGFLRISPAYQGTMPRATINYQTRSTLDTGANQDATWQYFGAPGANCQFTVDGITWLYQWNEKQNWVKQNGTLTFEPFAGYAITQYGQPTYSLKADPIRTNQTITLTQTPEALGGMNGDNLFANSFMAPIDVKNFTADDFSGDLDKTFYIFNSGSWNQWNGQNEKDSTLGNNGSTTPGQYCAIPALSAKYLDSDITTIPPMQGVYVIANKDNATIRLNYNKHIWQAGTYTGCSTDMHEPMRSPQRIQAQEQMQHDDFRRLRIQVNSANSGADRMYIIQEHTTTRDYDNGYDAPNQFAEGIANIYTTEPFGKMEVSCANNIDSMYIGFQAGSDSHYILSFRSLIGDSLYLQDMEQDTIIRMQEGAEYRFSATPYTTNDLRFLLLLHPQWESDNTPTHVDQVQQTAIWNDSQRLYITNAPAHSVASIYTLSGQPILHSTIQYTTHTIDIHHLPQGVYILRINNQIYKFVCQ